jgi:hypothetical protein
MDDVVSMLLKKASDSKMDSEQFKLLESQFPLQIQPILDRGKQLYRNGSQMNIDSKITAEGYDILIRGRFGAKNSFWSRLLGKR